MLLLLLLGQIKARCRKTKSNCSDISFSGSNVILFKDFAQLSSVSGRALFNPNINPTNAPSLDAVGAVTYRLFDRTVVLKKIIRQ